MSQQLHRFTRRIVTLMSAGLLLQAGGCTIDTNALVSGLVTAIANDLITGIVFGAFNLAAF
jgi:hypothetical protein